MGGEEKTKKKMFMSYTMGQTKKNLNSGPCWSTKHTCRVHLNVMCVNTRALGKRFSWIAALHGNLCDCGQY